MTFEKLRAELSCLLTPGRIGEFDHIELIEVIGTPRGGATINVLSVAVLSEGRSAVGDAEEAERLTERIGRIDGFKDWSFGVMRTFRPVAALDQALATLAVSGEWTLSGRTLGTGTLRPEPAMFAPPDGTVPVPLNSVLKNNFWAGSHVFRLTDQEKTPFAPFFADRRRLQRLSDAVSVGVPITFAGLADLLGDVLIQLPVTILVPSVTAPRGAVHSDVAVAWRSGAARRPLATAARTRWDELLTGAAVSERFTDSVRLPVDNHRQPLETEIWDEGGILVGATASTSTLKQIALGMHVSQHEPRIFNVPNVRGQPVAERVELTETTTSFVGTSAGQDANFWLGRRQDLEERRRLEATRDFVQYRPQINSTDEQDRALADLRFLINRHGHTGVDLWDPYLSAEDLLRTLFFCCHSNAPLRALTDGRDPPRDATQECSTPEEPAAPNPPFPDRQRVVFERDAGNREGLRLEYRTRRGPKGWHFHDRFLIFPNLRDGPRAWSLGTSVNSLGKAHHILQRVSNPAMVAGAFEDLWAALDEPQHVVWRSW
ncbi:VPA1262 family N-terminal domain-containing protein [Aurantimonas sp. Leaf443]|uniref:VPA1262 family N-terminal domain-containing protein n=1 Tax=Aurantimonas sp. Leaf443 TaxID=1736378 RepID=UPI0012E36160|nr:VPA1262 family N-terminal domain-containing protein [Aurantimonas sp. Leaf443]